MQEMTVKNEVNEVSLSFAKSFVRDTHNDLNDIKHKFFKIGFRLNEANEFEYYKALGYTDIYELAENEFGFKSTTTKNLMEVNRVYGDHLMATNKLAGSLTRYKKYSMEIDPRFNKYSQTQLVEMLPLSEEQRAHVPIDFKTPDLRDYKKAVCGRYRYGIGYDEAIKDPRKAVEEYRRVMEKSAEYVSQKEKDKMISDSLKAIDKLIKPKIKVEDVPPGQMYLDDGSEIVEFHEGSCDEVGQLTDQAPNVRPSKFVSMFIESAPDRPPLFKFKNRKERESFIMDEKNYPVLVLKNDELGIEVRRLDFRNGIKVYRTTFHEYITWKDESINVVKYHLVDPDKVRERPQASACCTDYTCRHYTLDGTALGYVVDYMTKYKDEI